METYQLKEYLGKIMKLETKKYELDNIINRLKEKVEIEKWIINQKCYPIDSVYPINMVNFRTMVYVVSIDSFCVYYSYNNDNGEVNSYSIYDIIDIISLCRILSLI